MKMKSTYPLIAIAGILLIIASCNNAPKKPAETKAAEMWSIEKAQEWGRMQNWLRGCDFIPSTAINQLEMWQAETFDPETIGRELRWADEIGMNCMRVYLTSPCMGN